MHPPKTGTDLRAVLPRAAVEAPGPLEVSKVRLDTEA